MKKNKKITNSHVIHIEDVSQIRSVIASAILQSQRFFASKYLEIDRIEIIRGNNNKMECKKSAFREH